MLSIVAIPTPLPARSAPRPAVATGPFLSAPDPRTVYPGGSFMKVAREIGEALQRREGLIVITGETGTGKTMLCRALLQELPEPATGAVVLDPSLSPEHWMAQVLT